MGQTLVGAEAPAALEAGVPFFFLLGVPFGLPGDVFEGVLVLLAAFLVGEADDFEVVALLLVSSSPLQVAQWAISSLILLKVRWHSGHSPPL